MRFILGAKAWTAADAAERARNLAKAHGRSNDMPIPPPTPAAPTAQQLADAGTRKALNAFRAEGKRLRQELAAREALAPLLDERKELLAALAKLNRCVAS